MTKAGWIFLGIFWAVLIITTIWSYRVLLSEPHIPAGPLETERHECLLELQEEAKKEKGQAEEK